MHAAGGKAGRPDAAFLGAGTSLLEITGVNRLPPHFFFIIKIKEIQSQDKNIIELWTEKIQEFTMTVQGPGLSCLGVHELHLHVGRHSTSIASLGLHLVLNGAD